MNAALRLRPHHILCALGFEGKGYSDSFTANMGSIVARLRAPEGADCLLEITLVADAICAPCPHRRATSCTKAAQIAALDQRHAAALGLSDGMRLTWGEACDRVRAHVPAGALEQLCAGCAWRDLGLCAAALARLHAAE